MRICFISLFPPCEPGGASSYTLEVINGLVDEGHSVALVIPDKKRPLECINGLSVIALPVLKAPLLLTPTFLLQLRAHIRRILDHNGSQIVHCNDISGALLPSLPVPVVTTIHHSTVALPRHLPRSRGLWTREFRGQHGITPLLERLAVKRCDRIIAVSGLTKASLLSIYDIEPSSIHVIYNGVADEFLVDYSRPEKPSILSGQFILLYVGRPEARKGIDLLLKVFRDVIDDIPSLSLIILGAGDWHRQTNYIEANSLSDKVFLVGSVSQNELMKWYRVCDAVVCPSYIEGFGLSVLEGMAVGKPVIAPKWSGVKEIVLSSKAGFIVDPFEPATLEDAIRCLAVNAGNAESLGRRGKAVARKFTWKRAVQETLRVYSHCRP